MIQFIFCVLLFCCNNGLFASAYTDCGSKTGNLVNMTVSGCPDLSTTCDLKRGTNVTLSMEFNLNKTAENVTAVVHGIVAGTPLPFNLPHPDACTDSSLVCPLAVGGPYTYVATLPIKHIYPKMKVIVQWELKDENNQDILCVHIPSKLR